MKKKIGIFIFIVICSTVMLSDWIERIYIGRLAGLPGRYNSYVGIQKEYQSGNRRRLLCKYHFGGKGENLFGRRRFDEFQ